MSKIQWVQQIIMSSFYSLNKKIVSTLAFNINLSNFPLSTCWGRTMLRSAQTFIYISVLWTHSRWDPIIKREMVWDPINMFYTATFWCLSQTRTWISNAICHGLFVFNDLRWQMVVHFVDNGGVDHHCLIFFYPLANEVAMGYSNATVRPSVASLWTL